MDLSAKSVRFGHQQKGYAVHVWRRTRKKVRGGKIMFKIHERKIIGYIFCRERRNPKTGKPEYRKKHKKWRIPVYEGDERIPHVKVVHL